MLAPWPASDGGRSRSSKGTRRIAPSTARSGSEQALAPDGRRPGNSWSPHTEAKVHLSSDFSELLSLLGRHRVKYIVVGGYAVVHHTEPRYTKDLDIFVEATLANARRLKRALEEFAGPLPTVTLDDLADPTRVIMIGRAPTRVDLLKSIDGVRFETAWRNRVRVDLGSVTANVIARRDLIRNKRASGRPQDLLDLAWLRGK
jgi:hypothetical protein